MLVRDQVRKYGWEALAAISTSKGFIEPNSHAFYVDKGHVNALDADDGEHGNHWNQPFATIAYAIARSNANASSYHMNVILVATNNYIESLTVLPHNTNLISIGAGTFITGAHTFVDRNFNCHFWGFWFAGTGVNPIVTIPTNSQFIGFHGCTFTGASGVTYGIEASNAQEITIEDCKFLGNPVLPTALHFTGAQIRTRVRRNWIAATTNGILIDSYNGDYGNLIDNNIITRQSADPNATEQMAYGIKMMRATGTPKWAIVKNSIEAVDAIYSATADTHFQNICIGNRVNAAGTGGWEDEGA